MTERGHAAVELALAIGVLLLPVALVVTSFGPWSEHRVTARSLAAEGARAAVLDLSVAEGNSHIRNSLDDFSVEMADVRVGWCGASPGVSPRGRGELHHFERLGGDGHRCGLDPAGGHAVGVGRRFVGDHRPLGADRPLPEHRMKEERGSVTIWVLGLSLLLLLFGGLAIDYWRALSLQRELLAVADSAAVAAASGIDEEHYRSTGEVTLDEGRARALAVDAVGWQPVEVSSIDVDVDPALVAVTLQAVVELGLLGVLVDETDPFTVRALSAARPVLVP